MATTRTTSSTRSTAADPTPTTSPTLITIIDGWMHEPQIRRFMLTILAMVLIGLVLIVGLTTGALSALINTVLPNLMAKVIAITVGTTLSGSAIALTRRRRIKRRNNAAATALAAVPSVLEQASVSEQ